MPRRLTFDEFLTGLTIDLGYDAVGLWQLREYGVELFGLSEGRLPDFYRRTIRHLLAEGAVPLLPDRRGWWIGQQLGETPDEVIEAVLDAWAGPDRSPGVDAIWFGRREVLDVV